MKLVSLAFALLSVTWGLAQNRDNPGSATPTSSDSTGLQLAHATLPAYPIAAADKKLQGEVLVKFTVSETGSVDNPTLVSGDPLLGQAAIEAAKEWKFKPFIKNGQPARVPASISFDFVYCDKTDGMTAHGSSAIAAIGTDSIQQRGVQVVWIGEDLARSLKIKEVKPEYPFMAKNGRIQGNVILSMLIGTDGTIRQVNIVSGHPTLAQAAVDAVKQWRYKPYLLSGNPVSVQTKTTVMFSLSYY